MFKTRSLGKILGVEVRLHGTFLLLLAFIALSGLVRGGALESAVGVGLAVIVFSIVVLHELGHIVAARFFGIGTRDIILSPIGGLARLKGMPEKPSQEIAIALAGPAVNLVLAALGYGILLVLPAAQDSAGLSLLSALTQWFVTLNLVLLAFNLVPALPMDGGRVLRAALTPRFGPLRATQIAAKVARWLALAMAIYAVWNGMFLLLLISAFVVITSSLELFQAKLRDARRPLGSDSFAPGTPFAARPGLVVDQDGNPVTSSSVKGARWVD